MVKLRFVFLPCFLLATAVPGAEPPASTDPVLEKFEPLEAVRGAPIKIDGENLKGKKITITLRRADALPMDAGKLLRLDDKACPKEPDSKDDSKTVTASDNSSVTFLIDQDACLGNYTLTATIDTQGEKTAKGAPKAVPASAQGKNESQLPGTLHIIPRDLKLTAVHPSVPYPKEPTAGKKESAFDLTVIGDGFSHRPEENALVFEDQPSPIVCAKDQDPSKCTPGFSTFVANNGHELHFVGLPAKDHGHRKVRVRVGDQTSHEALDLTLSQVSEGTPLAVSLIFTGVLCALIYFILKGSSKSFAIGKDKYSLTAALFMDKETKTYSLSKLQFYLWTGAAVMGYAYLTAARSLIQGDFEFADIPSGLPGILLASAATSVLALGITSSKGNKGSGEIHPRLSDFITSGGVIAADRLQFLVWTVVGVCSFLMLVFLRDPGTIQDLPKIPPGFLELMGISSAGYLGGKLGRKQGPRIEAISASKGSLILTISGAGLSQFASFAIDGTPVKKENIVGARKDKTDGDTDHLPRITTADTTNNEQGFARTLELEINDPDPAWQNTKEHKFTISNPDGQMADGIYKLAAAPSITSASYSQITEKPVTITITGDNIHPKFVATYTVADDPKAKGDPLKATAIDSNSVSVTISDVSNMTALKIANPDGQAALSPILITKTDVAGGSIAIYGVNFDSKIVASYTAANDPKEVAISPVTVTDGKKLTVTSPSVTGDITLKIKNPDGANASVKVTLP